MMVQNIMQNHWNGMTKFYYRMLWILCKVVLVTGFLPVAACYLVFLLFNELVDYANRIERDRLND